MARQALESVRGTALVDVLQVAFAKLTRGMLDRIKFSWSSLDEAFTRKAVEQNPRDIKRLGEIAESILNKHIITFYYRKLEADFCEARKVKPLHLGEVDGGWCLIAHDLERVAFRTFALLRMPRLKVLSSRIERSYDFDDRAYLKQSFGILTCGG